LIGLLLFKGRPLPFLPGLGRLIPGIPGLTGRVLLEPLLFLVPKLSSPLLLLALPALTLLAPLQLLLLLLSFQLLLPAAFHLFTLLLLVLLTTLHFSLLLLLLLALQASLAITFLIFALTMQGLLAFAQFLVGTLPPGLLFLAVLQFSLLANVHFPLTTIFILPGLQGLALALLFLILDLPGLRPPLLALWTPQILGRTIQPVTPARFPLRLIEPWLPSFPGLLPGRVRLRITASTVLVKPFALIIGSIRLEAISDLLRFIGLATNQSLLRLSFWLGRELPPLSIPTQIGLLFTPAHCLGRRLQTLLAIVE
jgi:hypothetical protein